MLRMSRYSSVSVRPLLIAMLLVAIALVLGYSPAAVAQFGGGGGGFGGGGGGFGGGGGGGGSTIGAGGTSGVAVDAEGVLHRRMIADPTGDLLRRHAQQAWAGLERDLTQPSNLRKVSLTRLERAIAERIAAGESPTDAMQHLAGLTRIQYVFCYPDSGDIVIAGPAEPWGRAPSGRMLTIASGKPVIELQDLVVALRTFAPETSDRNPLIYCSIDPTPEGLSRMQDFLRRVGRFATPNDTQVIVQGLKESLGDQIISIGGVSPRTHFAQVLVEADYRMKLIGIGLEAPPVRLASYVDRANPAQVSRNAMQRWYFVPDYECVRVSDDAMAMEIVGEGVKLVGEDEVVGNDGNRKSAAGTNRASQAFVRAFTKAYPELAQRAPVYAQLRNCIDLAVVAAFIQHQDYYGLVGWNLGTFADESLLPVETLTAPERVATAVNSLWKGRTLMTPVGGGVQIRASEALESGNLMGDESGQIEAARLAIEIEKLAPGQWWWD